MYRIVNRCVIHRVATGLSAVFLIAALSLLATGVEGAAGNSGSNGMMAKHSARHGRKRPAPAGVGAVGFTAIQ
jgi:hypothetical protein